MTGAADGGPDCPDDGSEATSETLGDVFLDAARHGDKPVLTWVPTDGPDVTVTYAALITRARGFAAEIDARVPEGGIVALLGAPTPDWYAAFIATQISGRIAAPLSPHYAGSELRPILERLGAGLVATGDGLRVDSVRVLDESFGEVTVEIGAMVAAGAAGAAGAASEPVRRRVAADTAVVLHTSGTTGIPKAAAQSHANYVGFTRWYAPRTMIDDERVLTFLSPCHQAGLLLSFITPVAHGGHVTQLARFTPALFWDAVRRNSCSWCVLIPPAPARLLAEPPAPDDRDHTLRRAVGNNTSEHHRLGLAERFGIVFTHEQLGSTETTLYSLGGWIGRKVPHPEGGFIGAHGGMAGGQMVPGWSEIRIAGPDGAVLPPDTRGEIQIHGAGVFQGYLDNEEQTRKVFTDDGWYRTGDIGCLDDRGSVYWIDRMHSMIRRSGENVSPAELEMVIAQLPAVDKVAVFGVPDEVRGEEIMASVVLREDYTLEPSDVVSHCLEHLAAYKVPRYVEIRDDIPMTISFRPRTKSLIDGWSDRVQYDRYAAERTP